MCDGDVRGVCLSMCLTINTYCVCDVDSFGFLFFFIFVFVCAFILPFFGSILLCTSCFSLLVALNLEVECHYG